MSGKKRHLPPTSNRGVSSPIWTTGSVDWLTTTCRDDKTGYAWYDVFKTVASKSDPDGITHKPWNKYGYEGVKQGSASWAYHTEYGYLLIVSGSPANDVWHKVSPSAKNVTRMDLAVTCFFDGYKEDVALKHYSSRPDNDQRVYSMVNNSRGGQTLYVGSRQSNQFGRVYDKGAQLGKSASEMWRYEVQINKPKALPVAKHLYESFGNDIARWGGVQEYVWRWFDDRGVRPVFRPRIETKNMTLEKQLTVKTSTDRTLNWLANQVEPSVRKLIEAGLGERVLDALELRRYYKIEQLSFRDEDLTDEVEASKINSEI
jgi:hypothetical protein